MQDEKNSKSCKYLREYTVLVGALLPVNTSYKLTSQDGAYLAPSTPISKPHLVDKHKHVKGVPVSK